MQTESGVLSALTGSPPEDNNYLAKLLKMERRPKAETIYHLWQRSTIAWSLECDNTAGKSRSQVVNKVRMATKLVKDKPHPYI